METARRRVWFAFELLSPARINMAEVYRCCGRAGRSTPQRASRMRLVPWGVYSRAMEKDFASPNSHLEQDLAKTTLAGLIDTVKASGVCGQKSAH